MTDHGINHIMRERSLKRLVVAAAACAWLAGCAAVDIPLLSSTGLTQRQALTEAAFAREPSKLSGDTGPDARAPGNRPDFGEFDISTSSAAGEMRFQPFDSMKVSVWGYPELDHNAIVQPNGTITLPLVGEIPAAGSTVSELRQRITEQLLPFTKIGQSQLRPGDSLTFEVWQHSELRHVSVIDPSGVATFPLVGRIAAAGRDVEEIRAEAERRMRERISDARVSVLPTYANRRFLFDHQVSVLPLQLEPRRAAVIGEVNVQGLLDIRGSTRLMDVLARAQIRNTTAEMNSIVVIRDGATGKPQYRRIRMQDFLEGRAPDQNIYLQNNDVVIVPRTLIVRVGDFVEQWFSRTAPVFTWWVALNQASVARESADSVRLINESLRRSLLNISVTPSQ